MSEIFTRPSSVVRGDRDSATGTDLPGNKHAVDVVAHDPNLGVFGEQLVASRTHDVSVAFNYNLSTRQVTVSDSGTAASTYNLNTLRVNSGTGVGTTTVASINRLAYRPGTEGFGMFTVGLETAAETGLNQFLGLLDDHDGFAIGNNGENFGVMFRKDQSDTWTSRSAFNGDDISWLDVTKLNIYMIRYGWLGIAPITYWVYYGPTRSWVLMHATDLTNTQNLPHINSPILPMCSTSIRSSGTGADSVMRSGSWRAGSLDNVGQRTLRNFTSLNSKGSVGSTLTNILTLRNKTTYQSLVNKITAYIENISLSSDGTKAVDFVIIRNATLGGTPSYADINTGNSVIEVDVAGTTVTGGDQIAGFFLGKVDKAFIDLLNYTYKWHPGDTLTIGSQTVSGSSDISVAINWGEEF